MKPDKPIKAVVNEGWVYHPNRQDYEDEQDRQKAMREGLPDSLIETLLLEALALHKTDPENPAIRMNIETVVGALLLKTLAEKGIAV